MNWQILINSFKADLKFVRRDQMLLMAMSAPFIIILLLKLGFPLIAGYVLSQTGFQLYDYYSIIALTMMPVIPMLLGLVYAFILLDENDTHILQVISVTPAGKKYFLYMRMITPAFLTLILFYISVLITDPVSTEGWLRSAYISFLMSLQAPFVFLFIGSLAGNKIEGMAFSKLYGVFLIAVPLGLILHHPWNYLAFFSPLYWISWAWITHSLTESLLYGFISILISTGSIIVLFRHFLKKHSN